MDDTLIERLEAASGPDREVDAEVSFAFTTGPERQFQEPWPPAFTASVDVALTLIPQGHASPSDFVREAVKRLGQKFDLHMMHWPLITPYPEYLARFIAAAALRAQAGEKS